MQGIDWIIPSFLDSSSYSIQNDGCNILRQLFGEDQHVIWKEKYYWPGQVCRLISFIAAMQFFMHITDLLLIE